MFKKLLQKAFWEIDIDVYDLQSYHTDDYGDSCHPYYVKSWDEKEEIEAMERIFLGYFETKSDFMDFLDILGLPDAFIEIIDKSKNGQKFYLLCKKYVENNFIMKGEYKNEL